MKKQNIALVLALLMSLTVLFAGTASAATTPTPSVFPIRYDAYGNSYSVTGFSIGTNSESGNTEITLYGSGYNKLPFRDGAIRIPVWCDFVSEGKTYESVSASASSEKVVISFDAAFKPQEIIIQSGETWEELATFKVADETVAKVDAEE